jgi:peptide/nickel transport system permease protein
VLLSVVVFAAVEVLPGDAATARTGGRADAARLALLREATGLDEPLWRRWLTWSSGLLRGDWGTSLLTDRPVADLVLPRLAATAVLTGVALLVAAPLVVALAWLVGTARPGRSRVGGAVLTALAAVPQAVVVAVLVLVLAGLLRWLPAVSLLPPGVAPLRRPEVLVLPALALALPSAAWGGALLAGVVADACAAPHVRDARVRGMPPWRVHRDHVAPFVLAPAVRVLAAVAAGAVSSAALVETVFGYRGLGELLVGAVAGRDAPVVAVTGLLGGLVVVAGAAVADLVALAVAR